MRKTVIVLLVACLLAALFAGPSAARPTTDREHPAAAGGAACNDVYVPLRMFKIEAHWKKKAYAIGEIAKLEVRVSRTADEDPVTEDGQPYPTGRPADEPAADVYLGVGLRVGDVLLTGLGYTDSNGKTIVPIRIAKYAKPGKGDVSVYGQKIMIEDFPSSACRIVIVEYGTLDPGPPVRIES